ncbi:MAG TPA: hypothetical protein VGR62_19090, partial [Candidatus Binatia bacterium]|nr:hypothetical protein [Candidatus Binatia bacterium]
SSNAIVSDTPSTENDMTATWIFYAGLGIDAIVLLMMVFNILVMTTVGGIDGSSAVSGLSGLGRVALWLMPLLLLALMAAAHRLKARGSVGMACLLLWLPALPFFAGIVLWGGLAVVFVLFGK